MGVACKHRFRVGNEESYYEDRNGNFFDDTSQVSIASKTVSNRWDPVAWFSQHGYNVSEMIKAPGEIFDRKKVRNSESKHRVLGSQSLSEERISPFWPSYNLFVISLL